MPQRRTARFVLLGVAALTACTARTGAPAPARLSPRQFAALSARLSEPEGYFDTDNLISNEDSYLHAVTLLARQGVQGGAYIGVGPDQNFSYIAAIRPQIAFIVDIRRANLLEHLLFKALFARARNRVEYLCLLFGKTAPSDTNGWGARSIEEIIAHVERQPADTETRLSARRAVLAAARATGIPLSAADLETIGRFHETFMMRGFGLRMTTYGRPERLDYPTYGDLLIQTDLDGREASYLAREGDFQFVKQLQQRNLVVPVVGDLAGPKAIRALGDYLESHHESLSAFYASNVEQYLFRDGTFDEWAGNLASLPHDGRSVIIRSVFPYGRADGDAQPGYLTVQLVQPVTVFLADERAGGYQSYRDLVRRGRG